MMDTTALIAIIVVIALLGIFIAYHLGKLKLAKTFEGEKERIRREAIAQSRAVLGGKFIEQLAPYLPEFKYDPTEARFIGSPIDLIIFPGLANGNPEEIVIMEIKTGKTGQLTPQERRIRQLIEEGMVRWELIHLPAQQEV